jgi:anti-sigma B factor antagonist
MMLSVSRGKPVVVQAPVELDAQSSPMFRDELALLISHGATSIVIDMAATEFLDSSGMGALVGAQKLINQEGGTLALHGVAPRIMATLRVAGLDGYLAAGARESSA